MKEKPKKASPFDWVIEPFCEEPSYIEKQMFGCKACYLHGRLKLVLASSDDADWNGLLIPTDKENHKSLREDFGSLKVHPILKKWLYLPEATEDFEEVAFALADRILADDVRIGVEPRLKSLGRM